MKIPLLHSTARTLFILTVFTMACKNHAGAQPPSTTGIVLREGVVIDPNRKEMYCTTPDNRVEAVSLKTGESLWRSNANFKPMAISDGTLICLGSTAGSQNDLIIAGLDLAQKGNIKTRYTSRLPEQVKIDFRQTANSAFTIEARIFEGEPYIAWKYFYKPERGILEEDTSAAGGVTEQSGAFKVDRVSGRLSGIDKAQQARIFISKAIVAAPGTGIPEVKAQQFLSKDEKHILAASKTADNAEFNNYRWDIYDKASGNKTGQIQDYRSYAPFYVDDNIIFYEVGPYIRVESGEEREVPLQIVAVDLRTGKELWSKRILDTIYRGPSPP